MVATLGLSPRFMTKAIAGYELIAKKPTISSRSFTRRAIGGRISDAMDFKTGNR